MDMHYYAYNDPNLSLLLFRGFQIISQTFIREYFCLEDRINHIIMHSCALMIIGHTYIF